MGKASKPAVKPVWESQAVWDSHQKMLASEQAMNKVVDAFAADPKQVAAKRAKRKMDAEKVAGKELKGKEAAVQAQKARLAKTPPVTKLSAKPANSARSVHEMANEASAKYSQSFMGYQAKQVRDTLAALKAAQASKSDAKIWHAEKAVKTQLAQESASKMPQAKWRMELAAKKKVVLLSDASIRLARERKLE